MKVIKLKMNWIKLSDMKIKLLKAICFTNQANKYMILKRLKQDFLVTVFVTTKLKYMELIKNKLIY